MSAQEIANEIADEPQPTVDPALNIQPHRQSPTPAPKLETGNSGHSSPHSAGSDHENENFQDINPLIQSTQHEFRAIQVSNPMSSLSEQPTPELASNFAPESAISREAYINVQSSTIPERNDGQYLEKNASPAEVTDYLRGLQSKLDTILRSSVVLHQSPLTSPVRSHSTFATKEKVDSMYSPSNDMFKYSNNFSDFNSFKARPVENSVYASVNNDAKFFSAREAPKSNYVSNRYDNNHINSSMVNVNGSMIGRTGAMGIVGSTLTTMSTYIPPSAANQYASTQKDRNQQVIEAMQNNEAKLDKIIENIRRKNAGGAVGALQTTESRVHTISSPQIYDSRITIASPQTMTRKTEFYSQPGETLKKSNFVSPSEYSSVQFRDREQKRSFQHDRQPSISNSYWLDNQEKSRYLGASTISNTHVPLKLRADRNNPADQGDREVVQEEGHQKIQRYYIPDPTVKERDTKDHNDMRAMQSRPMQFGQSGPSRREYRNAQQHLEVLEDDSAFHCQELEDDNQSENGGETQAQIQVQNQQTVKVNHEEFIYGGSETFKNKRGHQSKVEKPKVVVTKKNLEKVSQVQIKKEPSSGVERSQPSSSISKFFEKDSEIDDFVFE